MTKKSSGAPVTEGISHARFERLNAKVDQIFLGVTRLNISLDAIFVKMATRADVKRVLDRADEFLKAHHLLETK